MATGGADTKNVWVLSLEEVIRRGRRHFNRSCTNEEKIEVYVASIARNGWKLTASAGDYLIFLFTEE